MTDKQFDRDTDKMMELMTLGAYHNKPTPEAGYTSKAWHADDEFGSRAGYTPTKEQSDD